MSAVKTTDQFLVAVLTWVAHLDTTFRNLNAARGMLWNPTKKSFSSSFELSIPDVSRQQADCLT
jgi:hypothetical protein